MSSAEVRQLYTAGFFRFERVKDAYSQRQKQELRKVPILGAEGEREGGGRGARVGGRRARYGTCRFVQLSFRSKRHVVEALWSISGVN